MGGKGCIWSGQIMAVKQLCPAIMVTIGRTRVDLQPHSLLTNLWKSLIFKIDIKELLYSPIT